MKEVLKQARRALLSSEKLYRKLSRSQRVALLVVCGFIFGATLFALSGGGPGTSAGGSVSSESEVRSDSAGGGGGGASRGGSGLLSGLLVNPAERQAERRAEVIARLEKLLIPSETVAAASVVTDAQAGSRYVSDPPRRAAVKVVLRDGVPALQHQEAVGIRNLVAAALGVLPERVSISDNHSQLYAATTGVGGAVGSYADEGSWGRYFCDTIREHYARILGPDAYNVSVIVRLSAEEKEIEEEQFEGGAGITKRRTDDLEREAAAPGSQIAGGFGGAADFEPERTIRVKSKTEEEFETPRQKIRTQVPRGAVESVSALVLLDTGAVLSALEKDLGASRAGVAQAGIDSLPPDAREQLLAAYRDEQEQDLKSLLAAYNGATVRVAIQRFASLDASVPLEPREPVERYAAIPPWLPPVATGALALCALVGLLLLSRGLLPGGRKDERRRELDRPEAPSTGLPSAEATSRWNLGELLRSHGLRAGGPARAGALGRAGPLGVAGHAHFPDALLNAVEATNKRVRRRPEVAAAVLRFWLSQDADEAAEGANRS